MSSPQIPHLQAAYKVLKYLKKTPGQGLFLMASSELKLKAYCDVDWAAYPDTRRSVSRFCVFLVIPSYPGNAKSNKWCPDHQQNLSIVQ